MKKDDGLDDDCDIKSTLPAVLGAFILSNSERIKNNLIREINGFYNNSIYYGDTDSVYNEKKYWDVLDKAKSEKIYVKVKMITKLAVSFTVCF